MMNQHFAEKPIPQTSASRGLRCVETIRPSHAGPTAWLTGAGAVYSIGLPPARRIRAGLHRDFAVSLPFFAWATGAAFFFYAWVLRVAPSVMIDELMRDFGVGAAAVGSLSAFYFYGYAGMQIPVGMMIDRFGPRRLITASAAICALGAVLFALSPGFWGVAAGRFLIGASAAFSLVGAMAVAGQWFPATRFALLSGLAMMAGMLGGVFGQAPLRLVVDRLDWRTAMLLVAGGGLLIALSAWGTVRGRRRGVVLAQLWMAPVACACPGPAR